MRLLALLTAAAAAALTPGAHAGVGVTAVAFLAAATAGWRRRPTRDIATFGVLALALAAIATLRDNSVVVTLDLIAAFALGTFALCGPSLRALLQPFAALARIPAAAPRPSGSAIVLGRGVVLGIVVVVPFAVLFWSADAAFASILGRTPLPEGASLPVRLVTAGVVLVGVLALRLAPFSPVEVEPVGLTVRRLAPAEWIPALVALDLVFGLFVAVQLTVLFGGHDHVLETSGLTYAEYARSGYWQLLVVGALTFLVVGLAAWLAAVPSRRLLLVRRGLLGLLIALALVVLASALHRLHLYERALGFTPLRLYVETSLLWFAALFGLVLAAGLVRRVRAQLPRLAIALTAAGLLGFSLSDPDARVAEHNVDRWRATGRIDTGTLSRLSADAAPALASLPAPLRDRALGPIVGRLGDDGVLAWNRARSRAAASARAAP